MAAVPPQYTFFDVVGGEETFRRIVARFFALVPQDEVLASIYPLDDLDGADERLRLFLVQYWGGPTTYSDARGHPRLRMRHAPFRIGSRERDAWLAAMRVAVDEAALEPRYRDVLWEYLEATAAHVINSPG